METNNAKVITVGQIARAYSLYIDIFSEEDGDYPDRRVIANKEGAIDRLLRRMVGDDKELLDKASDIVCHLRPYTNDGVDDGSWKPLCDDFRKLGFIVVDGDSKGNTKKGDK